MTTAGGACPECHEPVGAADRFCEGCGADLRHPPAALQRGSTADHLHGQATECDACGRPGSPGEEYCPECGVRYDDGSNRVEIVLPALAGLSDRGLVHSRNEDALAIGQREGSPGTPATIAAVVCDGVSSVENPQLASRTASEATLTVLLAPRAEGVDAGQHMGNAVDAAAKDLTSLPYSAGRGAPSCTLVAALVEPTGDGPEITVGWVGDSRAYWLARPGAAEPSRVLTTDHSWAVEIVAIGELDEAAAAADPRAHAITRWMGADSSDQASIAVLTPAGPGVLLLCSDGLWNYLPDADDLAAAAFAAGDPLAMVTELVAYAIDCGGRDNITVVAVPIEGSGDGRSSAERTAGTERISPEQADGTERSLPERADSTERSLPERADGTERAGDDTTGSGGETA